MIPSEAFQQDTEHLTALAPAVLSAFAAQNLYADVFYEHSQSHTIQAVQHRTRHHNSPGFQEVSQVFQGSGIHAYNERTNRYEYVDGPPVSHTLRHCAEALLPAGIPANHDVKITRLTRVNNTDINPGLIQESEKKHLLQSIVDAAYSYQPDLHSVSAEYQDLTQRRCVINAQGVAAQSVQATLGVSIRVASHWRGQHVEAMATYTTPNHYGILSLDQATSSIKNAIRQVLHQHTTRPIRSGTFPVIFEGQPTTRLPYAEGNAAIWVHEAIGHLLEADQYLQYPCAPLQERLTSYPLSISDDASWGLEKTSHYVDDEATIGSCTPLVVDGFLTGLLTDTRHASILALEPTGNGRRQNYRFAPLPRMTTLYLHNGTATNESLVSSTKEGLYVKSIAQGITQSDTQQVTLHIREGYYIKDGKLTHPISNVTITGKGLDMLNNIAGIGNDLPKRPHWVQCKKADQVVPVSVAAPSVLIKEMNVVQHT